MVFLQDGFKYKKNSQLLLEEISPQELNKKTRQPPVRSLLAKILIVGNSK